MSERQINISYYDNVSSTNEVLKEMAAKGAPAGTVVVAWKQESGRGRLGRTFYSPEGGIYMSVLMDIDSTMTLTAKAAVAVRRAILDQTDKETYIKWVNDIIYKGKKVCGILAEVCKDKVVLGIGINFTTPDKVLAATLGDTAISLYNGARYADSDAVDLVNDIVRNLFDDRDFINDYRKYSCVIGKNVKIFQAGKQTGSGFASSIDDNCALHVIDDKNVETVLSTGEITVRI